MKETALTYRSVDGKHENAYKIWEPDDGLPKAVVQFSHGMTEHHMRYKPVAQYLCDRGIVCVGSDHLGHGEKCPKKELGYFGGKGSIFMLADDLDKLRGIIREKYPNLPYILYGHSMGSFVARDYISRYGNNIDGVIICGTAGENKALKAGIALTSFLKITGPKRRSKLVVKLSSGGNNDHYPDDGGCGWLTRDPSMREIYENDPLSGFMFTIGGYNEMFRLMRSIEGEQWASKVPQSLPTLIISGSEDPVGNYGEGVKQVYGWLENREMSDLTLKIYKDMRHELHNELGKEEVMEDVYEWISRVADGVVECRKM